MSASETPNAVRPRRWPWAAALVLVLLGAGAGYWFFLRPEVPAPPAPDLTGTDPEIAEAITEAREAVVREPKSGEAWGRLGMVLRAHDHGREANVCFTHAERLDPDNPRWPYLHALTLLLTDPEAGLVPLRRAADKAGGGSTEPRLRLAEVLLERRKFNEAEEHFERVLAQRPDHARALLGLGRVAYGRDDLDAAVAYLEKARQTPFARKAASELLATLYYRQGNTEALRELGDVAALPDDRAWPVPFIEEVESLRVGKQGYLNRAEALLRGGAVREALVVLDQASARYRDDPEVWFELGRTLMQRGQAAAAERPLREVVRLEPTSVRGWFLLGGSLHGQGDRAGAADCFRKAVKYKPDHALAHYNLGQCLKEEGDREGAREAFRAALRSRPGYREAEEQLEALGAGP